MMAATRFPYTANTDSPARPDLPTMYDLPSEDPEEPGLADDFHYYQPQLLRETFIPADYPRERIYLATGLNLYFDPDHTLWHKRPYWFAVLDKPAPREQRDLRLSYVIWQEQIPPYIVVELLSPGTEKEDLGRTAKKVADQPPTKWEVYEQILKIPYYVVFSRYSSELQIFQLLAERYHKLDVPANRLWFGKLGLGLGIWAGAYQGISGQWLRWYDRHDRWIATLQERERQAQQQGLVERQISQEARRQAEQARRQAEEESRRAEQALQQAEQERQRAERLAARLKALGIEPDNL